MRQHTSAYVSIRQHTSAYVSIRQHTSAYVRIRQHTSANVSIRKHTSSYDCTRRQHTHTSAHVSTRQHTCSSLAPSWAISTSAHVSIGIRQHMSAYVSTRQHTCSSLLGHLHASTRQHTPYISQHTSAYVSSIRAADSQPDVSYPLPLLPNTRSTPPPLPPPQKRACSPPRSPSLLLHPLRPAHLLLRPTFRGERAAVPPQYMSVFVLLYQ
jgi:hypothetical protein